MSPILRITALLLCALSLTACVSREQADDKLAKGCAAGVAAILPEGQEIGPIGKTTFTPSVEGPHMRHVTLHVEYKDGWFEDNVTYECVFEENFGFLKTSYTAALYNLKTPDQVYGKAGNEIVGDMQNYMKLVDAIRKAMY